MSTRWTPTAWWETLLVTIIGVVIWPVTMLVALGRAGDWQVGNAIVGGLFHAAMWVGIAFWAGWLP